MWLSVLVMDKLHRIATTMSAFCDEIALHLVRNWSATLKMAILMENGIIQPFRD